MPLWLQHLVVLTFVAACLAYAVYQGVRSLYGKKSRLGSCCAKGCASTNPATSSAPKIHFLPVEMLRKRR
jgi:negative regulator of sigma E activity